MKSQEYFKLAKTEAQRARGLRNDERLLSRQSPITDDLRYDLACTSASAGVAEGNARMYGIWALEAQKQEELGIEDPDCGCPITKPHRCSLRVEPEDLDPHNAAILDEQREQEEEPTFLEGLCARVRPYRVTNEVVEELCARAEIDQGLAIQFLGILARL